MNSGTNGWRVTWKRLTWARATSAKSRTFANEADARAFIIESLWGTSRRELGPLVLVKLERRPVGRTPPEAL